MSSTDGKPAVVYALLFGKVVEDTEYLFLNELVLIYKINGMLVLWFVS